MGKSLKEIAEELRNSGKKVQLIYAFNGTGKTRLSRTFKELITTKQENENEQIGVKVLYYSAFTEDLFSWDNDLDEDINRKLIIHPNSFISWVLKDEGQENNIIKNFQHYTNDKLTPQFDENYDEVFFSIKGGNDEKIENIKISKGEESCFIWCIFYSLFKLAIDELNINERGNRSTDKFDNLEYIFIDDPVSSLDENHLIELAVNIAETIKSCKSDLKFIVTTHNPLFYNVLCNEFNSASKTTGYKPKHMDKRRLEKLNDGTFSLIEQKDDSPFSYHLHLLSELEKVIESGDICKYHFNFLRNILEKTSTFLGYSKWQELLPEDSREAYFNRIINLSSHAKFSSEETTPIQDNDKRVLSEIVRNIKNEYKFKIEKI